MASIRRKKRRVLILLLFVGLLVLLFVRSEWFLRLIYPFHHQETIFYYADKHGVDPYLVAAVIRAESKFHPQAHSTMGARGLMQIMPETGNWVAEKVGMEDFEPDWLFDPDINICIGTWYLANLQEEFDDLPLALAAYNGGRGNVRQWLEQGNTKGESLEIEDFPFPETKTFVKKVLENYRRYQEIYQNTR